MNLNFGPKEFHKADQFGKGKDKEDQKIGILLNSNSVQIWPKTGDNVVIMSDDEAIKTAKAILRHYQVPFCNKV